MRKLVVRIVRLTLTSASHCLVWMQSSGPFLNGKQKTRTAGYSQNGGYGHSAIVAVLEIFNRSHI